MPPREPAQSNYSDQPASLEVAGSFSVPEIQSADIEQIRLQAIEAYDDKHNIAPRGDMLNLGAAATARTPEIRTAAEHAVNHEPEELTLGQFGHNIITMRIDAVQKAVNPSPNRNFIERRAAPGRALTQNDFDLAS